MQIFDHVYMIFLELRLPLRKPTNYLIDLAKLQKKFICKSKNILLIFIWNICSVC